MSSWRIEGAILPGELPDRISRLDRQLGGIAPSDYHLGPNETISAAASRAWSYLEGTYTAYRAALAELADDDPAIGLTREAWIAPLLRELGYGRVSPTPGGHLTAGDADDLREYPISHLWNDVPMHLLGWNVDLDRKTAGVRGAARAPQSMVQEYLNRTPEHLWALLTNGRTLRLLRDSTSLVGQAFVEFDLETIFDNEQFSDFVFLFALCHQSRLERFTGSDDEPAPVTERWIEKWRSAGIELGTRAMKDLRGQVEKALETLGTGYLQHPANATLRLRISSEDRHDRISTADYQRALLRQVYRLLFWMVAEDREALLTPAAKNEAIERYQTYFSSKRLRTIARTRVGTRHHDLATQTQFVFAGLGKSTGIPEIGVPGLGGIFASTAIDVLDDCQIDNTSFLTAIRLLSTTQDPQSNVLRAVNFQHLGAEELGGIYEGLLELHPRIDPGERAFTLATGAGNERKTTGSYYTPTSLIDLVLDTSLDPVLDQAESHPTQAERETALLALRVCDPACGSGHFLVAAARRIANRLARVRSEEAEPSIADSRQALHDVISACIYGVDLNPMAAELAKVSLWLEALEPGQPLGFLDAHIKVGNSLIGTTPALLAAGIPDGAFDAVTGDDKKIATSWKKFNKQERDDRDQMSLLEGQFAAAFSNSLLVDETKALAALPIRSLDDIALQQTRYQQLRESAELQQLKSAADAWTAAFFQRKRSDNQAVISSKTVRTIESGEDLQPAVAEAIDSLATAHRFFHWHVEFPDVFTVPDTEAVSVDPATGWVGGFDAMIGNPPWETVQLTEKEFFAERDPDIAAAATASKRKKLIEKLAEENPPLSRAYHRALRDSEATNLFVRGSGRYPLTARGKTNTYSIFAETFRTVINDTGRAGIITPTGLATDATTADFFADTLRARRLGAFFDFENARPIFEGVHRSFRFAVTSLIGRAGSDVAVPMAFMLHDPADATARAFTLTPEEILLLNPNTGTLPVFATRRDADITLGIYKRHPILIKDGDPDGNPWGLSFRQGLFNMSSDSDKFRTREDLEALGAEFDGWAWTLTSDDEAAPKRWLPLYEAKLLSHYDHRFATYEGATGQSLPRTTDAQHDDPTFEPLARYWVAEAQVNEAIGTRTDRDWLFGWRDIARNTDVRTMIPSVLPRAASGNTLPLAFSNPILQEQLVAIWSSLLFDFVLRQKIAGTHVTYNYLKQLAAPQGVTEFAERISGGAFAIGCSVAELVHTSNVTAGFGSDQGTAGPPFRWIPERRSLIQAEIDGLMMHVYGLERGEVEHVLDTFPVLRRSEEKEFGEFRTRRLVLDFYDRMATARTTNTPYETPITPPPGQGPRHEGDT